MKKLIFLAILCLPAIAWGAPFLVCDPPNPAGSLPTHYQIWEDDVLWQDAIPVEANHSLRYDMTGHAMTGRSYKAKACNGGGCSDFSNKWPPDIPDAPTNLRREN